MRIARGNCGRRSPRDLGRGDTLDTVERELIAPARLSDEQQSALWLYAW